MFEQVISESVLSTTLIAVKVVVAYIALICWPLSSGRGATSAATLATASNKAPTAALITVR